MNIFIIITTLSFVNAFLITAKVNQLKIGSKFGPKVGPKVGPRRIKMNRMIKSNKTTIHCLRLLKSLIKAYSNHKANQSEIASKTIMLAKKCSKIQAVRATIQKITLKHRNRYSLWWWEVTSWNTVLTPRTSDYLPVPIFEFQSNKNTFFLYFYLYLKCLIGSRLTRHITQIQVNVLR